jgi:hypothetical protein
LTAKSLNSEELWENKSKLILQLLRLMQMDKLTLGEATSLDNLAMEIKEIESCPHRFYL